jgi:hypothetical protein
MIEGELIPSDSVALVPSSGVPGLLELIRPAWQAKDLIARVRRLLPVDPSSACQRIFNAAIHDLREKVVIAGVDIAKEAAKQHRLPPIEGAEDIEDYSTSKLVELAYRMGLLSRPEWRRMCRVYEIRRDLEHEDDEYVAGVEDCLYVFKTCCEVVLSRDPVHLLRVADVKEIVEQPAPVVADEALLHDYEHAPRPRQEEICSFLISIALDDAQPDVVRQNAVSLLRRLRPITQDPVKLSLAARLQDRLGRKPLDDVSALVAHASGALPYLSKAQRAGFFKTIYERLQEAGPGWRSYPQHGELLRMLKEFGGLLFAPATVRKKIVEWLVLAYMGEPGGYGTFGRRRPVFYSDTAAPLVEELVAEAAPVIRDDLRACESSPAVKVAAQDEHVARRFQELLDIVDTHLASA